MARKLKKTEETKLMIIENFIDHIETNEVQRKKLKAVASQYVEEDHVDEIQQADDADDNYHM